MIVTMKMYSCLLIGILTGFILMFSVLGLSEGEKFIAGLSGIGLVVSVVLVVASTVLVAKNYWNKE